MMIWNKWRRLRDFVLVILIIISFLFTIRLWYGLSVHNLFVFFRMSDIMEKVDAEEFKVLPEKMIINAGNGEYDILESGYNDYNVYNNIYSSYNKILKKIMSNRESYKGTFSCDSKQWDKRAVKDSLNVKYGANIENKLFQHIFKVRMNSKIAAVSEVILFPDFITDNITCYVYDRDKQEATKYEIGGKFDALREYLSRDNHPVYYTRYSHDNSKKIRKGNYIYIPLISKKHKEHVYNVIMRNQFDLSDKAKIEDNMLKDYFVNHLVVRKYVSLDGANTYYDSESSLELYKSGYMEYSYHGSLSGKDGGMLQAYNEAIKMIKKYPGGMPSDTYISALADKGDGEYFIAFDYKTIGIPVKIPSGQYTHHAIEITVNSGKVVSYKRFAKQIIITGSTYNIQNDPLDVANKQINRVKLDLDKEYREFGDFTLCYKMTTKKDDVKAMPFWYIEIDNKGYFVPVKED